MSEDELNDFVEGVSDREALDRSLDFDTYLAQYSESVGAINAQCYTAFTNVGQDPSQFTTANSTNDLVGLLSALGYESFNLHGTSYGTRLALETVRRHPETEIRSVVLDSPSNPTSDRLSLQVSAVHDMVLRLFEVCEADAECNAAYPILTERTLSLLDQLANQPLTAGEETIRPDEFITQLTDLSGTRANYMPMLIDELEAGETTTYLSLLNLEVGTTPPEGAVTTPAVDDLVTLISTAGATPDDPFAGLSAIADITGAAVEENPRAAMKAAAEGSLEESESLPEVLERIDALEDEDIAVLAGLFANPTPEVDQAEIDLRTDAVVKNNALFMLSGIVCSEQLAFTDIYAALERKESLEIPDLASSDAVLATEVGNCTNYEMGEVDPTYNEPVSTDIPILILQGEFDVRTPMPNGLTLVEELDNAKLVIVPQAGHETWTSIGCVSEIATNFLLDPNQSPDLSCLEMRQENFVLPGQ